MTPKLKNLTICENVIIAQNKTRSYINIFDRVKSDLPVVFPKFYIVSSIESDQESEKYIEKIEIIDPDGNVLSKIEGDTQTELYKSHFICQFNNINFQKSGKYLVRVYINGSEITNSNESFVVENI
ncbi:MAG: hypothetical protein WCO35_01015 [Candidatus Nomurabacteria bacterium]